MSDNEYISLADAQTLTGISKDYFRICIQKGYLKGVKIGRNWLTKKEWVNEYLIKYRSQESQTNADFTRTDAEAGIQTSESPKSDFPREVGLQTSDLRSQLLAELKRDLFREFKNRVVGAIGALAAMAVFVGIGVYAFTAPPSLKIIEVEPLIGEVQPLNISADEVKHSVSKRANSLFQNTRSEITIAHHEIATALSAPRNDYSSVIASRLQAAKQSLALLKSDFASLLKSDFHSLLSSATAWTRRVQASSVFDFSRVQSFFAELFRPSPAPPSEIAIPRKLEAGSRKQERLNLPGEVQPPNISAVAPEVRLPEEVGLQKILPGPLLGSAAPKR